MVKYILFTNFHLDFQQMFKHTKAQSTKIIKLQRSQNKNHRKCFWSCLHKNLNISQYLNKKIQILLKQLNDFNIAKSNTKNRKKICVCKINYLNAMKKK